MIWISPWFAEPARTSTIVWSPHPSELVWLPVNNWQRNVLMTIVLQRTAIIGHYRILLP
jgi:hypothetical protein